MGMRHPSVPLLTTYRSSLLRFGNMVITLRLHRANILLTYKGEFCAIVIV